MVFSGPFVLSLILKPWACKDWQRMIYLSDNPVSERVYCDSAYMPSQEDIDVLIKSGSYLLIKSWKLD